MTCVCVYKHEHEFALRSMFTIIMYLSFEREKFFMHSAVSKIQKLFENLLGLVISHGYVDLNRHDRFYSCDKKK